MKTVVRLFVSMDEEPMHQFGAPLNCSTMNNFMKASSYSTCEIFS